jgi:hypothetical protein
VVPANWHTYISFTPSARCGTKRAKGRVVATDIAQPIFGHAEAKPVLAGAAAIEYLQSPAAPVAAPTGAFDAVLWRHAWPSAHEGVSYQRKGSM